MQQQASSPALQQAPSPAESDGVGGSISANAGVVAETTPGPYLSGDDALHQQQPQQAAQQLLLRSPAPPHLAVAAKVVASGFIFGGIHRGEIYHPAVAMGSPPQAFAVLHPAVSPPFQNLPAPARAIGALQFPPGGGLPAAGGP